MLIYSLSACARNVKLIPFCYPVRSFAFAVPYAAREASEDCLPSIGNLFCFWLSACARNILESLKMPCFPFTARQENNCVFISRKRYRLRSKGRKTLSAFCEGWGGQSYLFGSNIFSLRFNIFGSDKSRRRAGFKKSPAPALRRAKQRLFSGWKTG